MIFSGKYKEEVMAKEPWEEEIYDDGEETLKRTSKLNGIKADRLLTILAIIFFVVVVAMVCLLIFLQQVAATNPNKCLDSIMVRPRLNRNHPPLRQRTNKKLPRTVRKMKL